MHWCEDLAPVWSHFNILIQDEHKLSVQKCLYQYLEMLWSWISVLHMLLLILWSWFASCQKSVLGCNLLDLCFKGSERREKVSTSLTRARKHSVMHRSTLYVLLTLLEHKNVRWETGNYQLLGSDKETCNRSINLSGFRLMEGNLLSSATWWVSSLYLSALLQGYELWSSASVFSYTHASFGY